MRTLVFVAVLAASPSAAHAAAPEIITLDRFDGPALRMEVPAGYCRVDPERSSAERAEFELLLAESPGRHTLAYFIDCPSHGLIGTGWASNPSTLRVIQPFYNGAPIRYFEAIRAQSLAVHARRLTQEDLDQTARLRAERDGLTDPKLVLLGVDGNAYYTGFSARKEISGLSFHVSSVSGFTIVADHQFAFGRTSTSVFPSIHKTVEAEVKDIVARFIALNEGDAAKAPAAGKAGSAAAAIVRDGSGTVPGELVRGYELPAGAAEASDELLRGDPMNWPDIDLASVPLPPQAKLAPAEAASPPLLPIAAAFGAGLLLGMIGLYLAIQKRGA
jgi:hypothetical protein